MTAAKVLIGMLASLILAACAGTAPPRKSTEPAFAARRAVVKLRKRPEIKATVMDWPKLKAWAYRKAGGLKDDVACTQAIRKRAKSSPDGALSFALVIACTKQGKFRDLRLPFLRPWRKHMEALTPEQAARLVGQIISIRGAAVASDTRFTRTHGVFLDTLKISDEDETREATRFILMRGLAEPMGADRSLSIRETSGSGMAYRERGYWRYAPKPPGGHLFTGNWLRATAKRGSTVPTREHVFLAKRFGGETRIVGMWPVGVALPSLTTAIADRGVDVTEPEIERYVLDNGLTVILHEDHSLPLVHVNLTYRVGAYHEAPGRSGFAHLFEHLMFQGSENVKRGQHFALLQSRGASLVNAYTGFDRTSYVQTMPSHELELALWLEADRMNSLPAGLTQQALDTQKQVVRNERRERLEDASYGPADAEILKRLFAPGHAYREGVIGSVKELEAATLDHARTFFKDFYTTENATLIVAGDFDPKQARVWIKTYFDSIARRRTAAVRHQAGAVLRRSQNLKVRVPLAEHPRVSLVWAGPRLFGAGAAELELFAHLLSPSGANLLGNILKESQFDVRDVQVNFRNTIAGTWLELHVVAATKPKDLQQLVRLVQRVIKSYERSPLHVTELSALARSLERQALFSLQSRSNQAHVLAIYDHLFLDPLRLRWELNRFQQIVPRGVQDAVRTHLGGDQLVIYALPSRKKQP